VAADEPPFRAILHGTVRVGLPPHQAMHRFTPVGERGWVAGWDPVFPAGELGDGAAPGTVFITEGHGRRTLWVVVERTEDLVRYARVTPDVWAGTVEVRCRADGTGTVAEVVYDLTALGQAGRRELEAFARGYAGYLREWERLLAAD
jgi:hypothetical protein